MPLYEYECRACGRRFEQIQKFSDPLAGICPHCGAADVQKLLSTPAIQFKGSGWYITDYARKGAGGGDGSEKPDAKDSKDSKDTKDTQSAPADKSSTSSPANPTPSPSKD